MLSSLNFVISTGERNWILTDHVIFKLRYNEIYQMKNTKDLDQNKDIIYKINFYEFLKDSVWFQFDWSL